MDQLQMSKSTLLSLLSLAKENPDVPVKPSGIHAQDAGRCHQQGGKPYQVLASRAVHPIGPFQSQNRINKEIVILIYMCGVNLSVVHCIRGLACSYDQLSHHCDLPSFPPLLLCLL